MTGNPCKGVAITAKRDVDVVEKKVVITIDMVVESRASKDLNCRLAVCVNR
jgi:hypothetical protein